ncbi:unnamed protein product [Closterium sp. NIES-64]|nr:unnamed protein product [Closterium sp. NIES-64]
MKGYARSSTDGPTFAEAMALWEKKAALLQAQLRNLAAEEDEDSWVVSPEDEEVPQAEVEAAEEVYSLFMAAEGDSDPSSSDATMSSCFSDSSSSGQSSQEEPSTDIAVNSLCCSNYRFNCYSTYSKQYSDSSLLLDLVLLLVSFIVSKNVVTAVHLASRMGLLGADQSVVGGTPAASWRLPPTRRPRPGSTRVAVLQPAMVEKTMVTVSVGALQALKGVSAALGMKMPGRAGGVVCEDKKQPSGALVIPSGGGVKKGSAVAESKMQQHVRVGSLAFGAQNSPSGRVDSPPGGRIKGASAALQSKKKQQQVGSGASQSKKKQQQVGSAASQSKEKQQKQVGSAASQSKKKQQKQVGSAASQSKEKQQKQVGSAASQSKKKQQQQVGSAASQSKEKQQQVGLAASQSKEKQQQVGLAASQSKKKQQQQVGSAASQSKEKQQQAGLAASQSKEKQQQVGSAASQSKEKQLQVGSAASQSKEKQQQVGFAASECKKKQQEQAGGVRVGRRVDPSRMTRVVAIRPPWRP